MDDLEAELTRQVDLCTSKTELTENRFELRAKPGRGDGITMASVLAWYARMKKRQRDNKVRDRLAITIRDRLSDICAARTLVLATHSCVERYDYGSRSFYVPGSEMCTPISPPVFRAAQSVNQFIQSCADLLMSIGCQPNDVAHAVTLIIDNLPLTKWSELIEQSADFPLTNDDSQVGSVYGHELRWSDIEGPDLDAFGQLIGELKEKLSHAL